MLFGEAKCANLGRPNVSILGVANVLRPSDTQSFFFLQFFSFFFLYAAPNLNKNPRNLQPLPGMRSKSNDCRATLKAECQNNIIHIVSKHLGNLVSRNTTGDIWAYLLRKSHNSKCKHTRFSKV